MFDRTRLTSARKAAGLNKVALAKRSGLSVSAIQGYETGRRVPNAEQLGALAVALGCTADYLLGFVDLQTDQLIQRIKADPDLAAALVVVVSKR